MMGATGRKGFSRIGAMASAVLVSVGLAACGSSGSSTTAGKTGGEATFVDSNYPEAMDPAVEYTADGWSAMWNTYIPLLTYAHEPGQAGTRVIPGLAEDLPEISPDGKTYTLTLRDGLKYSDGTDVKASDFEF